MPRKKNTEARQSISLPHPLYLLLVEEQKRLAAEEHMHVSIASLLRKAIEVAFRRNRK